MKTGKRLIFHVNDDCMVSRDLPRQKKVSNRFKRESFFRFCQKLKGKKGLSQIPSRKQF